MFQYQLNKNTNILFLDFRGTYSLLEEEDDDIQRIQNYRLHSFNKDDVTRYLSNHDLAKYPYKDDNSESWANERAVTLQPIESDHFARKKTNINNILDSNLYLYIRHL